MCFPHPGNFVYSIYEEIDDPFFMTDDLGDPLATDELPYFGDYTFNGLLPGMDRAGLADLMEMDP